MECFFDKVGLQHPNLLKWNPTMRFPWNHWDHLLMDFPKYLLYGILANKWWILFRSFLNVAYIFMQYIGNAKQSVVDDSKYEFLKISQISQENTYVRVSIKLQAWRHRTLLKRDSNTNVFLWNLGNLLEHLFCKTPPVAVSGNGKIFHRLSIFY